MLYCQTVFVILIQGWTFTPCSVPEIIWELPNFVFREGIEPSLCLRKRHVLTTWLTEHLYPTVWNRDCGELEYIVTFYTYYVASLKAMFATKGLYFTMADVNWLEQLRVVLETTVLPLNYTSKSLREWDSNPYKQYCLLVMSQVC